MDIVLRSSLPLLAFALLLTGGVLAAPVAGEAEPHSSDPELARHAHQIAQDLMSPFCPGRTLADCPSPSALAVREQIRALLGSGASEAEIRERLGAAYGDAIVGVPRGAIGWLIPILLLLAGAATLMLVLRRLSAPAPTAPPAEPTEPTALAADLDRELQSRGL